MADAKLTADIVIKFNEEMLKKFNTILKESEKSLKAMVTASTRLSNVSRKTSADASKATKNTKKKTEATKKNTEETKKNTDASERNNRESKKRASQATRTSASFGKLTAMIAKVRVALGLMQFAAGMVMKTLAFPTAIATGWFGFLKLIGNGEREFSKMAKSVQVSTRFLKAFSKTTKEAGLSADNAVDMLEEMSNKVGDGLETPTHGTSRAFKELGLNLKEVQKMSRQKGLTTIMDSIIKFRKNGGNDQKSVRFADEIFGGEGNKFLGYMLETNQQFSDLIENQMQYNLASEETSAVWDSFGQSTDNVFATAKSALVEGLGPAAKDMGAAFDYLTWLIVANQDTIIGKVKEVGEDMGKVIGKIVKFAVDNKDMFSFGLDFTVALIDQVIQKMDTLFGWLREGLDLTGQFIDKFNDIPTIPGMGGMGVAGAGAIAAAQVAGGNNSTDKSQSTDNRQYNVYVRGDGNITQEEVDQIADDIEGIEVY